jgi:hypothetical protein
MVADRRLNAEDDQHGAPFDAIIHLKKLGGDSLEKKGEAAKKR